MFFIYQIIISLITIISPLIILFRIFKKKEDPKRFKEKFCIFSKKKIKGKLVWFHGASVGEILSVIPLIEKLEKNKEIDQILITSNTLSSSKILSSLKLKKTIHQFFPIDTIYHTTKFLNYWNPKIAIFIDSEIWPNMITNIKKRSVPLLLLNARITKKSFLRWKKHIYFAKNLFEKFDFCFPANLKSKKYLKILGAKKIKFIGNLKFSQRENDKNYISNSLKKNLLSRKVWCASSTHNTEEKYCGIVHNKLKAKYKNLLTIIIPRHIDRTESIFFEMNKLNLKVQVYSSKKKIKKDTDIFLIDSFGKTKSFFKICKTVFLGGSIIKHGGQNPIEAVKYGCKVLHGPNIWNFEEIYNLLRSYGSTIKVNQLNDLTINVDKLFKNKNNSKKIKSKIESLGNKILHLTLKELNFFLIKNETKKT
jgi:3-deoxy-D-manno-octulosonic-acid transferase